MTQNLAIFDQSFFSCIDEFLDSLFTVGKYKPESRSRTCKFTEIRRKKYSKICHNVRKFRLCRQISTSKKNSKKKLKKHFGYSSTRSNRFGRKISKIRRYSRERTVANFANFHQDVFKKTCFSMFALITLLINTQKFKKMRHCLAAY